MKKIRIAAGVICLILIATSCVSSKKYNDLLNQYNTKSDDFNNVKIKLDEATLELTSSKTELQNCAKNKDLLKQENDNLKQENSLSKQELEELQNQLKHSNSRINEVLNDKSKHLTELSNQLATKEQELRQKEENLDSLQNAMFSSQEQIKKMKTQLEASNKKLEDIHNKLKQALFGFEKKGLSIENKNGKIYVSMDEKLLFSSGSWQVSEEGKKALSEMAVILANNTDIDIMIEGHTDNVELKGKNQIKDNWDLSVMRATSITKILLSDTGIAPQRIIPCGRSEYMPIADNKTAEGRAKNRRTEIILSPKINELLNILQ